MLYVGDKVKVVQNKMNYQPEAFMGWEGVIVNIDWDSFGVCLVEFPELDNLGKPKQLLFHYEELEPVGS